MLELFTGGLLQCCMHPGCRRCPAPLPGFARRLLNWNEKSNGVVWLKRIRGALIIIAAVYLVITAP